MWPVKELIHGIYLWLTVVGIFLSFCQLEQVSRRSCKPRYCTEQDERAAEVDRRLGRKGHWSELQWIYYGWVQRIGCKL